MTLEKALAVALVVGVVSPLFWLGVNVAEGKLKRLLSEVAARRKRSRRGSL